MVDAGMAQTSSNRLSPVGVVGEDIGELHAGAGFRHHRGDGVAPELVMGGFLVRGGRGGSAIGFDEHEARWIVLLLDNVEPGNAGSRTDCRAFSRLAAVKASTQPAFT